MPRSPDSQRQWSVPGSRSADRRTPNVWPVESWRMSEPAITSPDAQSIFGSPKILYHADRLLPYVRRAGRGTSAADRSAPDGSVPITMEIDLTNVCSHRCPLCVGHRTPNSDQEQLFPVAG